MIRNERQYRITKAQAERFAAAIWELEGAGKTKPMPSVLERAQLEGLHSQLADLWAELDEYDALRSGERTVLELASFEDLPRALIQARIAAGLSQRELAERVGLKEQQIQRYEATEYASASVSRLAAVMRALGIQVRETVILLPEVHRT